MDEGKQTLIDIIIGIIIFAILFVCLGLLWNGTRGIFIIGVIIGAAASVVLAIQMYHTVERTLDMEEKGAVAYSKKKSIIRLLIMAVMLVLAVTISGEFMTLGVLMGMLCLKFSAYIQPLTHKYISSKFINKGR